MSNKNITTIITLVFVVGLGLYVYWDIRDKNKDVSQNSSTTPLIVNNGIEATGDYTLEQVSIEKTKTPAPDLNRLLTFSADLSPEVKKIITNNVARLVTILKGDNSQWNAWLDLGSYRKQSGDYEGARQVWEYAAILAPESYVSWNNLGDLYAHYLKDYPKAEENFKKAVALKPDYIGGYRALYELYYYSYKAKANLAPQVLKDGLAKNPRSTDLMVLLAQYYKETGDKTQARSYYNQTLNEFNKTGNTSMSALIQQELTSL